MKRNHKISSSINIDTITSILIILSTMGALIISNSSFSYFYNDLFKNTYIIEGFNLHSFINDFLMAIFFLLAGLEIKEEILYGSLSSLKKASFPVLASLGGIIVPALIFMYFNMNTKYMRGVYIPISTDIAFSLSIYYLFSKYLKSSLRMFLLSLAVVDDLASMLLIGTVYYQELHISFLFLTVFLLVFLYISNKVFKIESIVYYLLFGVILWYFIYQSGIHSTISGVLLALVIPTKCYKKSFSTSYYIRKYFNLFNNLVIMPLFAFSNTGIEITSNFDLFKYPSVFLGIYLGLLLGKPLCITIFTYLFNLIGITKKPKDLDWTSIFLVSLICSIGFTMSIFVSEVAFVGNDELIDVSRFAILITSFTSISISSLFIKTFKELNLI